MRMTLTEMYNEILKFPPTVLINDYFQMLSDTHTFCAEIYDRYKENRDKGISIVKRDFQNHYFVFKTILKQLKNEM